MLSLFDQELEKVDFWSDPEAARNKINQWVSNKTKGNIQDLIPSQGITQDTDLVLSNAVYFKGLWKSRFNSENTKKSIFYQAQNNATLASFMYQKGTFNHSEYQRVSFNHSKYFIKVKHKRRRKDDIFPPHASLLKNTLKST